MPERYDPGPGECTHPQRHELSPGPNSHLLNIRPTISAVLCCTQGYQQRVIEGPFWRWLIRHAAVGDVRRASYDAISDTSPLGAGCLNLDGNPVLLLNKRDKSSEERREGGERR